MAKHPVGCLPFQKRCLFVLLIMLSISTVIAFLIKAAFDSCDRRLEVAHKPLHSSLNALSTKTPPNPLTFMKSKQVLLVSHELSLSGILFILLFIFWVFELSFSVKYFQIGNNLRLNPLWLFADEWIVISGTVFFF